MSKERELLIIEDNPADVRLMREALRDRPRLTLRCATDGDEALRMLRKEGQYAGFLRPTVIFLDFNLPKSDSRDLLRQIKSDPILRTIPVAVLTSSDSEKDIRDAYALHANCYIRKPAELDAFFEAVRSTARFWLDIAQTVSE